MELHNVDLGSTVLNLTSLQAPSIDALGYVCLIPYDLDPLRIRLRSSSHESSSAKQDASPHYNGYNRDPDRGYASPPLWRCEGTDLNGVHYWWL